MSRPPLAALACLLLAGPAPESRADLELGRAVYERHCVYCHGSSGDARTTASAFLDPKPRDFTSPAGTTLTRERIQAAVRDGRPGTAMQSFSSVLDRTAIAAVGDFVFDRFVIAKAKGGGYHTAANGWPDDEAARAALALATGEPVCLTCHDGGGAKGLPWDRRAVSSPQNTDACAACHADRGASPYRRHESSPVLAGPSAEERRGEELFRSNCAFCHAADGSGRNWIGTFLEPHPRNLDDPGFRARTSRSRLADAIRDGLPGTSMPAWRSVLEEPEVAALVAYLSRAFGPFAD